MKLWHYSLALVLTCSVFGISSGTEGEALPRLLSPPADSTFSPCEIAREFNNSEVFQLAKEWGHIGFWTCVAMENSGGFEDTRGNVSYKCRNDPRLGIRCEEDLFGIFNLGPKFWCENRITLPDEQKGPNCKLYSMPASIQI